MDPDYVLSLYDSCWFDDPRFIKDSTKSSFEDDMNIIFQEASSQTRFLKQPSILIRSKSDPSHNSDCFSPTSTLVAPHLQTILSGKEVKEDALSEKRLNLSDHILSNLDTVHVTKNVQKNVIGGRKRKGMLSSTSKSLSDLEFEELKGFMDLGFVFSEEDKESSLVDIIPGLQRLGQENDQENDEHEVTRPYLSEAWEVMEEEKRRDALIKWRVPAPENEIDMKDSLKWWAHTVASAVR